MSTATDTAQPNNYCSLCKRWFIHELALRNHSKALHYSCERCRITLDSAASLDNHLKCSTAHCICETCGYDSFSPDDLRAHKLQVHQHRCESCKRDFFTAEALAAHRGQLHPDYHYCLRCEAAFYDKAAVVRHHKTSIRHQFCVRCNIDFPSFSELHEHYGPSGRHYICVFCRFDFDEETKLRLHLVTRHTFSCKACKTELSSRTELIQHYKSSNSHHYCLPCNQHFSSTEELTTHLEESVQHGMCFICDTDLSSPSSLFRHNLDKHGIACGVCDQRFWPVELWNSHIQEEHYQFCQSCDSKFLSRKTLDAHVLENHSYSCPICAKISVSLEALQEHQLTNHSHSCQFCTKVYESSKKLQGHWFAAHCHGCTTCGDVLSSLGDLEIHHASAHGTICTKCHIEFHSNKELGVHLAQYPHSCRTCKDHFTSLDALQDHEDATHSSYACKQCDWKCDSTRALEEHRLESHVHPCGACTKVFLWKHDLQNHKMEEHGHEFSTSSSPLKIDFREDYTCQCVICLGVFESSDMLQSHAKLHSDNDYGCFVCGKKYRFLTYGMMIAHLEASCKISLEELNKLATEFSESSTYVVPLHPNNTFSTGTTTNLHGLNFRATTYKCAWCKKIFALLSGLLHHVEKGVCGASLYKGRGSLSRLLFHLWEHVPGASKLPTDLLKNRIHYEDEDDGKPLDHPSLVTSSSLYAPPASRGLAKPSPV